MLGPFTFFDKVLEDGSLVFGDSLIVNNAKSSEELEIFDFVVLFLAIKLLIKMFNETISNEVLDN